MAMDTPASAPPRTLPPHGAYLSALFDLGRRSIPLALPALVFLWFYHFGTALYLQAAGGTSLLGYRDSDALMVHALMKVSAYLPLLVLVYTPFLPLQDALLRGERVTFLGAIRHVLERMVPFVLSVLLQTAIVLAPVVVVAGIVVSVVAAVPDLPRELVVVIAVTAAIPLVIWLLLSSFFLVFAIPGVVLTDLGATTSISASTRLVGRHFWGLFTRFFVFFLILCVGILVASIPAVILGAGAAALVRAEALFRMGSILWTSLVTAVTFPFSVGALLVLYRSVVPAPSAAGAVAASEGGAEAMPREGEHPAPFQFE
jgi:hypothetical protein